MKLPLDGVMPVKINFPFEPPQVVVFTKLSPPIVGGVGLLKITEAIGLLEQPFCEAVILV